MEEIVVLTIAVINSTYLPLHLLHHAEQVTLLHRGMNFLKADDEQSLGVHPFMSLWDRLTLKCMTLAKKV